MCKSIFRQVLIYAALIILMGGCLEPETRCTYYRLEEKTLYNNIWKVDTFRVFCFDSATNYLRDTTYVHDGTLKFIPDDPYNCNFIGGAVFTRGNGSTENMRYSITVEYYRKSICFKTNSSFDGFPDPSSQCSCFYIQGNKLSIKGWYYFNCGLYTPDPAFNRYWYMSLSKL